LGLMRHRGVAVASRAEINKMTVPNLGLIFSQCMNLPPQLFRLLIDNAFVFFPESDDAGAAFPWPGMAAADASDSVASSVSDSDEGGTQPPPTVAPPVGPSPAARSLGLRSKSPPTVPPTIIARKPTTQQGETT